MELHYKSWDNIPIKVYNRISQIIKETEEKTEESIIPILSILYNVPEQEISSLKIMEVQKLIKETNWINKFSFDKEKKIEKLTINGVKCRVKYNLSDFTYQQYLDYNEYFSKIEEDPSYLANVLATFILPENKKYNDGYDLQQLTDDIEDTLPITQCQSLIYSFVTSCLESLSAILTSSANQTMKKIVMKKKLGII